MSEILWELFVINFRYELVALNRLCYQFKLANFEQTSQPLDELDASSTGDREIRILGCIPHFNGRLIPECPDVGRAGFASFDNEERRMEKMTAGTIERAVTIESANDVSIAILNEFENRLARHYFGCFVAWFRRAPVLPDYEKTVWNLFVVQTSIESKLKGRLQDFLPRSRSTWLEPNQAFLRSLPPPSPVTRLQAGTVALRCIYCNASLKSDNPLNVNAHNRVCQKYKEQLAGGPISRSTKVSLPRFRKHLELCREDLRWPTKTAKTLGKRTAKQSEDDVSMRTAPSMHADNDSEMAMDVDATAPADLDIGAEPMEYERTPSPPRARTPSPPPLGKRIRRVPQALKDFIPSSLAPVKFSQFAPLFAVVLAQPMTLVSAGCICLGLPDFPRRA
ncbi:hypothetical protein BDZ89DRAFT_1046810 [Hymenopellis radicata]|nr:hypothetical protein BDZ89DRAFT_1046810 [Hymenopellis radicata]